MAFSVHTWRGMQTTTNNSYLDSGDVSTANLVVGSVQPRVHRKDEQSSEGTGIAGFMKVIAPLTSTGPAVPIRILHLSATMLIVRFPHIVFAGSLVQIRIQSRILFGKARCCDATESEYEIDIEIQELY